MAIDLVSMILANDYTEESLLGGGAVVGKNVTISSIVPIDGGNRVTFSYTLDNGTKQTSEMTVKNGLSVTNIDVNANNQIVFIMSDGTEFISGKIPTVKGDKGDAFTYSDFTPEQLDSLKGADGYTPVKGTDYWTADDKAEIQSYIDTQIGGALNGSY